MEAVEEALGDLKLYRVPERVSVNAQGTLVLLEATRQLTPDASFVFTSTNKVYGDTPNRLPLVELESRWELDYSHRYGALGIDESMSIDQSAHSLFGASKVAADVLVVGLMGWVSAQIKHFRCAFHGRIKKIRKNLLASLHPVKDEAAVPGCLVSQRIHVRQGFSHLQPSHFGFFLYTLDLWNPPQAGIGSCTTRFAN